MMNYHDCGVGSSSQVGKLGAPLLGTNLVRLLYLDDSGTDRQAPFLCVAGVLIHGDRQWPEVDKRIVSLIERYINPADRLGFVFHATDIFHGSGYFDRRKAEWADQVARFSILCELAAVIGDLSLPVVFGKYEKDKFGVGLSPNDLKRPDLKNRMIHNVAAMDCLIWSDRWLAKYAPTELAAVVHEDGADAKRLIKAVVRTLRSDEQMTAAGFTEEVKHEFGLPLKRIIDTVHFAEKPDARPLQLADLCAFALGRITKGKMLPAPVLEVFAKHSTWISEWKK
jgi:Protein of unknown function (DUF3800)